MSRRFQICLIAWIAVIVFSALSGTLQAQPPNVGQPAVQPLPNINSHPDSNVSDADWVIAITPARKVSVVTATSVAVDPVNAPPEQNDGATPTCGTAIARASSYAHVYATIPFNRAEYNSNPSYRHDSTMELLTGNSRHTTIVRHGAGVRAIPVSSVPSQTVIPYGFVRPSLRLNYYRHFPSLNRYWNRFWNDSGIR